MTTPSKRDRVSKIAASTGFLRLLEFCPRPNTVLVLNYHHVGNWRETEYDEELFSADGEQFHSQVQVLKKRGGVVSLEEALSLLLTRRAFKGTAVLITFDDGYLDNYTLAFPILKNAGLPATFFLATSFIGSSNLPWWDEIAFLVRHCQFPAIQLDYPNSRNLSLGTGRRETAIRELVTLYKRCSDPSRLLAQVRDRCEVRFDSIAAERLFLDWNEAREMAAAGMDIGAHTHTHRNVGRLSLDDQLDELRISRERLEAGLARRVDVMAYPYGARDSFNRDTYIALERLGYRAAFSYYGGINRPGAVDRYNLARCGVAHPVTIERFRAQIATQPLLNGYWF